jgi:hypothetical protein
VREAHDCPMLASPMASQQLCQFLGADCSNPEGNRRVQGKNYGGTIFCIHLPFPIRRIELEDEREIC